MSGTYIFYVGYVSHFSYSKRSGYVIAGKFMKSLRKQKEVCNIKYEELPIDPKEGTAYFSFAPAVKITFDLKPLNL